MAEIVDVTLDDFSPSGVHEERFAPSLTGRNFSFRQFGSIAKFCEPVNANNSIEVVDEIFKKNPNIEAVPIELDGHVVGTIDRFELRENTNTTWKRLFPRPCLRCVKICPIVIFAHEYIQNLEDAVEEINKEYGIFYFPVFDSSKTFLGTFSLKEMRLRIREISDRDFEKATLQQRNLMPTKDELERLPFRTTIWTKMANKVGGDLCVIAGLDDKRYIAASFDVSGKNVAAAMVTMTIGSFFTLAKMLLPDGLGAAVFVSTFDTYLTRMVKTESFVTAVICFIDIGSKTVEIYNCGHTMMYVVEGDDAGKVVNVTKYSPSFAPLGLGCVAESIERGDPSHNVLKLNLTGGMHLGLTSDGFTDMLNSRGVRFEDERVKEFFVNLYSCKDNEVAQKIETAVAGWIGDTPLPDDISVMDLRF